MRLLLDTHIFLWLISEHHRVSDSTLRAIRNRNNQVYLSVVSLWETVVKQQIGRLSLPEPAETYLRAQRERHEILALPVDEAAVTHLARLPLLHRDPFDRMLLSQAIQHRLTVVSHDARMRDYDVQFLR